MTGTFDAVLAELAREHRSAMERHGFTDEHDDRHDDQDWAWRILRRVSELMAPPTVIDQTPDDRRRALLEVAHIAASAVAAHDRRWASSAAGVLEVPAELGGATFDVSGLEPPPLVTSTDDRWRYVTRPGDAIERHTLTCATWRPGPGITCTGACTAHLRPEDLRP